MDARMTRFFQLLPEREIKEIEEYLFEEGYGFDDLHSRVTFIDRQSSVLLEENLILAVSKYDDDAMVLWHNKQMLAQTINEFKIEGRSSKIAGNRMNWRDRLDNFNFFIVESNYTIYDLFQIRKKRDAEAGIVRKKVPHVIYQINPNDLNKPYVDTQTGKRYTREEFLNM